MGTIPYYISVTDRKIILIYPLEIRTGNSGGNLENPLWKFNLENVNTIPHHPIKKFQKSGKEILTKKCIYFFIA